MQDLTDLELRGSLKTKADYRPNTIKTFYNKVLSREGVVTNYEI